MDEDGFKIPYTPKELKIVENKIINFEENKNDLNLINNNNEENIKILENNLKKFPTNHEILFNLIYLYKLTKNWIKFEKILFHIIKYYPLTENYWLYYFDKKLEKIEKNEGELKQKFELIKTYKKCLKDFFYSKIIKYYFELLIDLNISNIFVFDIYTDLNVENIKKFFDENYLILFYDLQINFNIFYKYYFFLDNNNKIEEIDDLLKNSLYFPFVNNLDEIWKKFKENNNNVNIINKYEKIYKDNKNNFEFIKNFNDSFFEYLKNDEKKCIKYLTENKEKLIEKYDFYIIFYYYEKYLEIYYNDSEQWKNYFNFVSINTNNNNIKIKLLKRMKRFCPDIIEFYILYLNELENNSSSNYDKILLKINKFYTKENTDSNFKFEILKFHIEFLIRNFNSKSTDENKEESLNQIRSKFSECINFALNINSNSYLNIFYHIWAEFETYSAKNKKMLCSVMNKVCELFPDLNSIRAYLYYIKTLGDFQDVRETYTYAYDLLENEEDKEKIKFNWIQWEKLFGSPKSLNNILRYMNYKDNIKNKNKNQEKENNFISSTVSINNDSNKNEDKKVIIKNLPPETTEENLRKFIKEKCATLNIKNLRLIKDENGKNRGFAFIDLHSIDEANFLISELNNQNFLSHFITCAISKSCKSGSNDFRTIFVNNLSFESTEETIEKVLNNFGNILEIRLIKDSNGRNKGYCYVEFQEESSVEKILEKKNEIFIDGRKVIIEKSISNKKIRNNIKFVVFVSNLNFKVKEKDIENFLKEKKNIEKEEIKTIKICKEENDNENKGKSKGFGFIEFNNFESMNKSLELNNEILKGRNIIIKESERNITEKKEENNFLNKKHKNKLNNQDFKKLFD